MRKDLLLDENNDLLVEQGDFVVGNSDLQHVQLIMDAAMGEFKQFPLVGFGIISFIKQNKDKKEKFKRDLKIQLEYDGYKSSSIDLTKGFENLKVDI